MTSIPSAFEAQVQVRGDCLAISDPTGQWTYRALDSAANRVARHLMSLELGRNEAVALLFEPGLAFLASLLGVLKCGHFFIPLDGSYPVSRNRFLLEDARARVLLTDDAHRAQADALGSDGVHSVDAVLWDGPACPVGIQVAPAALASVLYTSGSSGQPKGVMHSHETVLDNWRKYTDGLQVSSVDRITWLSSCSAGASYSSIFGALLNGATLFPFNVAGQGLTRLCEWLAEQAMTIYHSTPSLFRHFTSTLEPDQFFPHLRMIKLGGEATYAADAARIRPHVPPDCVFHVGLGMTEMNIVRQYNSPPGVIPEDPQAPMPVGYPVGDTEVVLWDEGWGPVGPDQVAEIVVRSPRLSLGYWRRPALTAERFVPEPWGGGRRLFRTGDLGTLRKNGCLVHRGRNDDRIKIRGFRVEPLEVEAALLALEAVRDAAVVAQPDARGENGLIAYVALHNGTPETIRSVVSETLPAYMLPTAWVVLDALPRTPNGKIDRRSLPACLAPPPAEAPTTDDIFGRVKAIWQDELGRAVGDDDNFFEIGGHSLLALTISHRIERELGVRLPLSTFLVASSLGAQRRLVTDGWTSPVLVPVQASGDHRPLFLVPGLFEEAMSFYRLAGRLGPRQPVYAFHFDEIGVIDVARRAGLYLESLRTLHPRGPYRIGGFSIGGIVAYEMAQQLQSAGQEVELLVLIDTWLPGESRDYRQGSVLRRLLHRAWRLRQEPWHRRPGYILAMVRNRLAGPPPQARRHGLSAADLEVLRRARPQYQVSPYQGRVAVCKASLQPRDMERERALGWDRYVQPHPTLIEYPGAHADGLEEPGVSYLAAGLSKVLNGLP